ncbi:MAG: hypothetical protein ACM3SW_10265 [Actinomycetota bacterium]
MTNVTADTPVTIREALVQMERAERIHKLVSYVFLGLVILLPLTLFLAPKGVNGYDVFVVLVLLYNTLFVMWIKQDVNANAARLYRILTLMRQEIHHEQEARS